MTTTDPEWDRCDRCGDDMAGDGWIVPTGRRDDELDAPVVELLCHGCGAEETS